MPGSDEEYESLVARVQEMDLTQATPEELAAIEVALKQGGMGNSFRDFIIQADPAFQIYQHCDYIIDHLQALYDGDIQNLMVWMPPRHSKSYLGTLLFPAYYLFKNPNHNIILTACSSELARSKFSIELREFMRGPGVGMELTTTGKDIWRTPQGGSVLAVGAGGTIIGFGAHLFVIDDPVKNRIEATSPSQQQQKYDWYRSVVDTRSEPGCKKVMIMQRWDDNDLAGRIIETEGDYWTVLQLPAVAMDEDPLGRKPGEALCPERYPIEDLERKRASMGRVLFEAMYQQQPVPEGGMLFNTKDARYFDFVGDNNQTISVDGTIYDLSELPQFIVCDLALTTEKQSDFSVIGHFTATPLGDLILVNLIRMKELTTVVEQRIIDYMERHKECQFAVIERSVGSIATVERMEKEMLVKSPSPTSKKAIRAVPAQVLQERGKFWTPSPEAVPWMLEFEHELYRFPNGKHDDQVDVVAWATEYADTAKGGPMQLLAPSDTTSLDYQRNTQGRERTRSKLFRWTDHLT